MLSVAASRCRKGLHSGIALDSESEAAIQQALANLMEAKTVVAIAHRLSTLLKMDRIVVLEDGRVVEDGGHAELLALCAVMGDSG